MSRAKHDTPVWRYDSGSLRAIEQGEVGHPGAGCPYLLAGDRPPTFDGPGHRADAGQVGAGARLRQELTPGLVTADDVRQVPGALLGRPVLEQHRREHLERHGKELRRHPVSRGDLGDDIVLPRRAPVPAALDRPRPAGEPGVEELPLPPTGEGPSPGLTSPIGLDRGRAHDVNGREVVRAAFLGGVRREPPLYPGLESLPALRWSLQRLNG